MKVQGDQEHLIPHHPAVVAHGIDPYPASGFTLEITVTVRFQRQILKVCDLVIMRFDQRPCLIPGLQRFASVPNQCRLRNVSRTASGPNSSMQSSHCSSVSATKWRSDHFRRVMARNRSISFFSRLATNDPALDRGFLPTISASATNRRTRDPCTWSGTSGTRSSPGRFSMNLTGPCSKPFSLHKQVMALPTSPSYRLRNVSGSSPVTHTADSITFPILIVSKNAVYSDDSALSVFCGVNRFVDRSGWPAHCFGFRGTFSG